jgi:hypothetical protein
MRVRAKKDEKGREKMATIREGMETKDGYLKAILSLQEEDFVKKLISFPYLLELKEVKGRLKLISEDWKRQIEKKKSKESIWEYTLYFVHLSSRLLDLPEFRWLKERYYDILMMRLWSSEHDRTYWDALEKVRKDFTPTKPKTPEKKFVIAREFEYYRNLWMQGKISETCRGLLEVFNDRGRDEDMKKAQLLRRIKLPRNVMERELGRLARIRAEQVKAEGDFIMLPLLLQGDLNMMEDERDREEGKEFWTRIWKPISKEANKIKSVFIGQVAKETGMSKETVRKLLRKSYKEMGEGKI